MLRAGQKLGKYRLLTKLSVGTFATVFRAFDTLEGVYVALKIPHPNLMNKDALADFTKEVKLAARLDHPNILGLKTADYIDGQLVIAFPLGEQSLDDRL
ncbi:MAG: serine/threonine protein kinase, partial [Pirellulales bacterium]